MEAYARTHALVSFQQTAHPQTGRYSSRPHRTDSVQRGLLVFWGVRNHTARRLGQATLRLLPLLCVLTRYTSFDNPGGSYYNEPIFF